MNLQPISSIRVTWSAGQPPDIIKVYLITTPARQLIGISRNDIVNTSYEGAPFMYWKNPSSQLFPNVMSLMNLYPLTELDALIKALKPNTALEVKLYLPRFEEEEWQRTNSIFEASI